MTSFPLRAGAPPAVSVRIVYQTDPHGVIAGGIDTFIRGIAGHAPEDFEVGIVGLTADPVARPVGRWLRSEIDGRPVDFFPVGALGDTARRSKVPLTARVAMGVLRHFDTCLRGADVLDFHRAEAAWATPASASVRHCFIHQHMGALRNRHADIRWSAAPCIYDRMEARVLRAADRVYCVREDAARAYRARFPERAARIAFLPTWTDPRRFHPPAGDVRDERQAAFDPHWGLGAQHTVAIAVGRLDRQKNPALMVDAFARAAAGHPGLRLLWVGDGALRADVERRIEEAGLAGRFVLAGLLAPQRIAAVLRAADLYLMSSAYEGMPISVLEALASGLPVVSTDVGEVRRVIVPGRSGEVIDEQSPEALAAAIDRLLGTRERYTREACVASAAPYTPRTVLSRLFDAYREDVARRRAARRG